MRKVQFLLFALLILFATACKQNNSDAAIDYNNQIVDYQYSVVGKFDAFIDAVDSGDSLASAKALQVALDSANACIKKIKAMPAFDGSTTLRDDALALIEFYARSMDGSYRQIYPILVNDAATLEDLEKADAIKEKFADEEDALYAKLEASQKEFAVKHKFDLIQEKE